MGGGTREEKGLASQQQFVADVLVQVRAARGFQVSGLEVWEVGEVGDTPRVWDTPGDTPWYTLHVEDVG